MNEGCVPTKAMIRSAEVMHLVARRAAEFGVEIDGKVRFNLARAVARKDHIVGGIVRSIYHNLDQRQDTITFIRGEARFLNDHEIETGSGKLSFEKAIIATGARNVNPSIAGLAEIDYLTNRTALALKTLPASMIIIGGGYVGLEFAQMYSRFGTQVTLVGRNPHLAPGDDEDLTRLLGEYLREEGINVHTNAPVKMVKKEKGIKIVTAEINGEEIDLRAEAVLLAAGRIGNTDNLNLKAAGIDAADRGFVAVNDQLRTSQAHIWAVGDVTGGLMFTHVATYEGPIAALNAVKGLEKQVDYRTVPHAIFTDPSLAAVGMTEADARAQGYDVAVGEVPADGARAKAIGDTRGKLKALVDRQTGEILGFHILAPHGDILLHEAVAAMHDRGPIERIAKSIHVHPTLSEMVKAAAKNAR